MLSLSDRAATKTALETKIVRLHADRQHAEAAVTAAHRDMIAASKSLGVKAAAVVAGVGLLASVVWLRLAGVQSLGWAIALVVIGCVAALPLSRLYRLLGQTRLPEFRRVRACEARLDRIETEIEGTRRMAEGRL